MNPHRRGPWLLSLLIVASVVVPSGAARAATRNVTEQGTSFSPRQLTVAVGDTVVWTFKSSTSGPGHTVTFDNGTDLDPGCEPGALLPFNCQNNASPTRSFTFTSVGTFPYYCKIHGGPGGQGMSGVVIVTAATTTTTLAPSSTTTTVRALSTTTTARATSSSTTSTTRQLATSSTVLRSSTTTLDTSSALEPGAPPPLSGDSNSGGGSGGSGGGSDRGVVALIVGLLLAVSAGGGVLLWRLRPGRS